MDERPNEKMSNLCTKKLTLHSPNHTVCIPNAKNTNHVYQKGEQLRFIILELQRRQMTYNRGEEEGKWAKKYLQNITLAIYSIPNLKLRDVSFGDGYRFFK